MQHSEDRTRARLADLTRRRDGWVPQRASGPDQDPDPDPDLDPVPDPDRDPGPEPGRGNGGDADQALDREATLLRSRAAGSALSAYTAAYGHPLEHPADAGRGERRWATTRRAAVAASVVLVVLTGAVAMRSLGGTTTVLPAGAGAGQSQTPATVLPGGAAAQGDLPGSGAGTGAETGAATEAGAGSATAAVVVHVVGQVRRPGLVELASGARVSDAIEAAGGPTARAELTSLNLARPLTDGEQVHVPAPGEQPTSAAGTSPAGGDAPGSAPTALDLNTADAAALDALPGIGPVLAERIVAWRAEHGRFTSVDELTEVSGIGPAVLGKLRDVVRV